MITEKRKFLGLEFERDAVTDQLRIRCESGYAKAYIDFRAPGECWTVLSGPDLISLEAMVNSLNERGVFPGPEIVATVKAEIERRKPKLPKRVGPWSVGKPDLDQDIWVSAEVDSSGSGTPLRGHIRADQLIPELTRITLETLAALFGGWQAFEVADGKRVYGKEGLYFTRRADGSVRAGYYLARTVNWDSDEVDYVGPIPLNELAKVGRP